MLESLFLFFQRVFSFEFCEIFKNTFSYRAPPVAASVAFILKTYLEVAVIACALKA